MDQVKIGAFLKDLRKKKGSRRNSWLKNWGYLAGLYPDGKPGAICRISVCLS